MPFDGFIALRAVGWSDRVSALLASATISGVPGRVARADRAHAVVVTPQHTVLLPSGGVPVTTGDWVVVSSDRIAAVLPRWSQLRRGGGTGADQLLAVNIDVVAVAVGLDRPFNPRRLERLLTLAWDAPARPVVVLTKADAATGSADVVDRAQEAALGCEVVLTSATTGEGVAALRAAVPEGRTMVLVGESGAGKSTLVNRLSSTDVQATAAVRRRDAKGRHTTTARELVPLPGGGVLLDTPGLRAVGLPAGAGEGLTSTFAEIAEAAQHCRFRNCQHRSEPGCAVIDAVAAGRLAPQRLAAYLKLGREIAYEELRSDERARRAQERVSGRQARAVMQFKRRSR